MTEPLFRTQSELRLFPTYSDSGLIITGGSVLAQIRPECAIFALKTTGRRQVNGVESRRVGRMSVITLTQLLMEASGPADWKGVRLPNQ